MKKLIRSKTAWAMVAMAAALTGCGETLTDNEARIGGAVILGGVAEAAGATDLGVAIAVIGGATAGGMINRAQNGGCRLSSFPQGSLVFRSVRDGAYLNCQSSGLNNPVIRELRASPEWVLQSASSYRQRRSFTGFR